MATPVIMPRQGQSVESCIITKWNKQVGDKVAVGDLLFTYETDKATFDEESQVEGTLLAILHEEGDDVPCLENVCVIGAEGEDVSQFMAAAPAPEAAAQPETAAPVQPEAAPAANAAANTAQVASKAAEGDIKISPRARAYAEKTGVDYRYAVPSGAEGRIIERDIVALREQGVMVTPAASGEYLAGGSRIEGTGIGGRVSVEDLSAPAAAAQPADAVQAPEYEDVKLTNIRKVIARSMTASLSSMAQLTLNTSFDATELMAYRKKVKENGEKLGLANITLNDMVLYAVSRTLPNHKDLNAHLLEDKMRYFTNVHLGMAVDTERGLMVPTIFNANKLSLNDIAVEAKKCAADCQKGSINPDKLSGASFTVSNLGSLGIESFTPVINPPQTGILGVDNIVTRVKEVNGQIKTYPAMGLSLTFDHRALDGAPAAKFLKELAANLENFSALLAK
ncbi:MAG TPA: 2-oxo acid dehydrogenase subunit E2 [Firmicutes bacterium]|nr:2-oxo acid dehydrogenase subunit E2 [Bacillota bacterium]